MPKRGVALVVIFEEEKVARIVLEHCAQLLKSNKEMQAETKALVTLPAQLLLQAAESLQAAGPDDLPSIPMPFSQLTKAEQEVIKYWYVVHS